MPGAPKDGIPHPNRWGLHRSMGGPQDKGPFADGAAFVNATPISDVVVLAGSAAWRHRFKATGAGTLQYRYLRPVGPTDVPYDIDAPADQPVVANTEVAVEATQHFGESRLRITFTPSANGNITWSDISEI